MRTGRGLKKFITLVLALVLLAALSVPAFAASSGGNANRTVRMGFFDFGGMFEGAEDGAEKSGYCYEYMMQVSIYTGWKYEYVYGTYAELYEKLKNGEIDILPYTNYNEQRAQEVLFSNKALAEEEYYIAVNRFNPATLQSLKGAAISTLEGADYNSLLLDFIDETGLNMTVKYYPNLQDTWTAVEKGDAQVTVFTSNAYEEEGWRCVCSFGKKPTYIAVAQGREDLLSELNNATSLIDIDNPALLGELYANYFSDNPMRRSLSAEEELWINAHPVLHVGGFLNDAPYYFSVDNESRTATGLTPDVVNGIIDRLDLNIKADYRGYATLAEMEAALDSGELDLILPFYPSFNIALQHNLSITKTVRVSNMELVYPVGMTYYQALKKIATPATKLGIFYVQDNFPQSEIVGAESIQDAVDKVLSGEATGAIAQNVVIHNVKEKYDNLNYTVLSQGCGTCFATRPENYPLVRILNRGLNYFTDAEISSIASNYTLEPNVTTRAYLAAHSEAVIMLIVIFLALVALTLALLRASSLKKKADEANRSKSEFLFNMSHDIRTPMNAILGFTNIAQKHLDDPEKVSDCLSKTQQAGSLLLKLINSVLDMNRIESGRVSEAQNEGDVYLCFSEIESTLGEVAAAKKIDLRFEFGEIENRFVYADFNRCVRILTNLISNAVKYTPSGGWVKARCEQITPVRNGTAAYRFTVADNGIGMSREFQQHMFESFTREQNSTVSGIQGTGLGLSVCKSFVDYLGGTISCRSAQGEGTTFTVDLPFKVQEGSEYTDPVTGEVKSAGEDASLSPEDTAAAFAGKRVLLVEDNAFNREIAQELLEESGLTVETAENGQIALDTLKEKGPQYYDFILMDIQMPVMDGFAATKAIRALYPDVHIPIIAVSANAFEEDKATSKAAGMDDHVAKPIDVQMLRTAIARFL